MKIAIIGGGWIGSHLAHKLKKNHKITLFDKNDKLFLETSYNNQNRLHIGYHYPRSSQTRDLCKSTFYRFVNDYNFLVKDIDPNIYSISSYNSFLDFNTYLLIYCKYNYDILNSEDFDLKNIEGSIKTNEKYINYHDAHLFFNRELKNIFIKRDINIEEIDNLKNEYDYIINATNNHLNNNSDDYFYELTLTLIYKKINDIKFNSLTVMDGKFISLYPYIDDLYTLTDVEYTPIGTFDNVQSLYDFKKNINENFILDKKKFFEKKINYYFPDFINNFEYNNFFLSTKSKFKSNSDNRYPIITKSDNLINCFTGKIQGIYIIEDYINNIINENTSIF
jgi:hypothetical protein